MQATDTCTGSKVFPKISKVMAIEYGTKPSKTTMLRSCSMIWKIPL